MEEQTRSWLRGAREDDPLHASMRRNSDPGQGLARHVAMASCHNFPLLLTCIWKQLTVA